MKTKERTVLMVEPGKHPSTTMNIYRHVLPSVGKEAAQKIGVLVYDAG